MGPVAEHHLPNNLISTSSPSFYNLNAQVTRTFPKWDVYLGGENLANFRQKDPIIGAGEPFGEHFDAGMAWGPVVGRMIYAGIRYKIIR
jgi:outer membrane receptor for ferrienterochelin and colicins